MPQHPNTYSHATIIITPQRRQAPHGHGHCHKMNFLLGTRATPNLPPHLFDEGERGAALIEKATSDILLQVDWAAMMEVVDAINHASDQAVKRELVRQIRKRLQSR